MNATQKINAATAVAALIGIGSIAYASYQAKKLDHILEEGAKQMAETKFTIWIPRPPVD